jgi:DNA-binding transcriptional LysR family regulator
MELKWLDDYLAFVETGSFSAAAEKRHISQPAFSRRIQQLEEWLGVALIDRSHKPLCFTPLAEQHEATIRRLVTQIYELRATLRTDSTYDLDAVLAVQHSLAGSRLPAFIEECHGILPDQKFRIRFENHDDGVALLIRGEADVLLTYEPGHAALSVPQQLATACTLGNDALVLVASPQLCASARLHEPDRPLPLLCFPSESFFGKLVRTQALAELMRSRLVAVQCVSEFSLGLREMALIQQGAAWLPRSLIAADLARGTLCELDAVGARVPLTIVAYFARRSKQALQHLAAEFVAKHGEPAPDSGTPPPQ